MQQHKNREPAPDIGQFGYKKELKRPLRAAGRAIPDEVAVVGFDDRPMFDLLELALTVAAHLVEEMDRNRCPAPLPAIENLRLSREWSPCRHGLGSASPAADTPRPQPAAARMDPLADLTESVLYSKKIQNLSSHM